MEKRRIKGTDSLPIYCPDHERLLPKYNSTDQQSIQDIIPKKKLKNSRRLKQIIDSDEEGKINLTDECSEQEYKIDQNEVSDEQSLGNIIAEDEVLQAGSEIEIDSNQLDTCSTKHDQNDQLVDTSDGYLSLESDSSSAPNFGRSLPNSRRTSAINISDPNIIDLDCPIESFSEIVLKETQNLKQYSQEI
jgi:hypothetical protein